MRILERYRTRSDASTRTYEFEEEVRESPFCDTNKAKTVLTILACISLFALFIILTYASLHIAWESSNRTLSLSRFPRYIVGLWGVAMIFASIEGFLGTTLFSIETIRSVAYAILLTISSLICFGTLTTVVYLAAEHSFMTMQVLPLLLTVTLMFFYIVEREESTPRDSRHVQKRYPNRNAIIQCTHICFALCFLLYIGALVVFGFYMSVAVPFCVYAIATSLEIMESRVTDRYLLKEQETCNGNYTDYEEDENEIFDDTTDSESQIIYEEVPINDPNPLRIMVDVAQRSRLNINKSLLSDRETVQDKRRDLAKDRRRHSTMQSTLNDAYELMVVEGSLLNKFLKFLFLILVSLIVVLICLIVSHVIPCAIIYGQFDNSENNVTIVAHRGYMGGDYPVENTLSAFRRGLSDGADRLELDVQMTKDGRLIVMHDYTLDRTTNGTGSIVDHTFEQIQSLRIVNQKGEVLEDEKIPTYEQVLELIGSDVQNPRRANLTTELKFSYLYADKNFEETVYNVTRDKNLLKRVDFLSLSGSPLVKIQKLNNNNSMVRLYVHGVQTMSPSVPYSSATIGSVAEHLLLNPWMLVKAHNEGKKVYVWFEKQLEIQIYVQAIVRMGVDQICVNNVREV
ncbi:hypothetical protein AKO1_013577, partial [Acrasis kona]